MFQVFISYSYPDRDYALKLENALAQRGFDVWRDDRAAPGEDWPPTIRDQLDASGAVIVLVTPHALQSTWVRREFVRARHLGKPIFPFQLEGEEVLPPGAQPPIDLREGALPPAWFYFELEQALGAGSFSAPVSLPDEGEDGGDKIVPEPPPPSPPDGPRSTPESTEPVLMSAHYPRQVAPMIWQPLLAYVFRASAAGDTLRDAQAKLGEDWAEYSQGTGAADREIAEGAHVTATPHLDGFQFNPLSLTIGLYDAWQRLDFQLRAANAPLNQFALGAVTFSVEGIIVADVPLSIYVTEAAAARPALEPETATPYDKVFCSYSHRDTGVVERVEVAYQALGMDYLRDVHTLKSGEDWNRRLLAMIEEADIFQLFWSTTAAESKYVRQEWMHALELDKPAHFIRPVFWQDPMPAPPPELGHIHFRYEPTLAR